MLTVPAGVLQFKVLTKSPFLGVGASKPLGIFPLLALVFWITPMGSLVCLQHIESKPPVVPQYSIQLPHSH